MFFSFIDHFTGLQTLKSMVSPEMLEKADNTMSELVELIDLNNEIADGLTNTIKVIFLALNEFLILTELIYSKSLNKYSFLMF